MRFMMKLSIARELENVLFQHFSIEYSLDLYVTVHHNCRRALILPSALGYGRRCTKKCGASFLIHSSCFFGCGSQLKNRSHRSHPSRFP
jgi:hypothetical protein